MTAPPPAALDVPFSRPRILLKARPTPAQLAERLEAPVPDGVELYIHEADVSGPDWFATLAARFAALSPPAGFLWVVEGPVWSLDGELFGLGRNNATDRDLVERLVRLASHLGAGAVNIHCVDGSPDVAVLDETARRAALERALPFVDWYAGVCRAAGLLPLIENVPPICRMRRAAFVYTPIGVEPRDLVACAEAIPGLGITLDTSHAQLAVNAFRAAATPLEMANGGVARAVDYYHAMGGPATLPEFIDPLLPWVVGVHVSNAAGVLDEGRPYESGDADLDTAVRQLATRARYFVTEPLDTDEDHPIQKRAMQRHLARVLGASAPARLVGQSARTCGSGETPSPPDPLSHFGSPSPPGPLSHQGRGGTCPPAAARVSPPPGVGEGPGVRGPQPTGTSTDPPRGPV